MRVLTEIWQQLSSIQKQRPTRILDIQFSFRRFFVSPSQANVPLGSETLRSIHFDRVSNLPITMDLGSSPHLKTTKPPATMSESYPGGMTASEIIEDLRQSLNPEKFHVKGCELHQMLVGYAELHMEPVGWQALWVATPKTSDHLKARLRSPIQVEVANVDYESLEALVEVCTKHADGPTEHETVLLTELHPLVCQENSAINIEATHRALQKIRFFYNHLLLPWDSDIRESWFEIHLPVRVKMYCEMRCGMNPEISGRYHFLLSEAHEIEKKLQLMATKVPDSEDEMEESLVSSIAELNSKLEGIQQDVEIILNPETRMLLFGSKVTRARTKDQPDILLVVQGQSCTSLNHVLNEIEANFNPESNIRCYPSLQTALDDYSQKDDVIVVSSGIHSLLSGSALRHGGTLMGIGAKEDVVVHLGCSSEVGLAFDDGTVNLKNLTVLVNKKQSGISIKGKLTLEGCIVRGASVENDDLTGEEAAAVSSWKGFYIAQHARLVMERSTVTNFDVGLRIRSESQVLLSNSEITKCNIGILAEQHAVVEMINTELSLCKEFAIGVEMDPDSEGDNAFGGIDLLHAIPESFQTKECRLLGNTFDVKLEY